LRSVVLVSADGEWKVVKSLLRPADVRQDRVAESFEFDLQGNRTTFLHGGWGRVSAAATTQYVIDQMQPKLLVNLGTCGGFERRIERGQVILVERTVIYDILEQMTDSAAAIEHYSTVLDLSWLPQELPSAVTRGLLVSGDRDIVASDIPHLVDQYGAVAADWESGAIAWVANRNHQRLLILRGVSDIVGSRGGEAYGNYELFLSRATEILTGLLDVLPAWLATLRVK
jgi:adenosylhomocysteine nucleosidase